MPRKRKEPTYAEWLQETLETVGMTISDLAKATGLSYAGVSNIYWGNTVNPQTATRGKIENALNKKPSKELVAELDTDTKVIGLGNLVDFTPHDTADTPDCRGIYVLYDSFNRPVYVGRATQQSIRKRIKQHSEKFWFREPIVHSGKFIEINDASLCSKIEIILIKFLGSHNYLNKKGVAAEKTSYQGEEDD